MTKKNSCFLIKKWLEYFSSKSFINFEVSILGKLNICYFLPELFSGFFKAAFYVFIEGTDTYFPGDVIYILIYE